ncbi:Transposase DDE domain protein [Rubripirellula lacrimiformis]|uniref:Transposase DDE domain protein n=1 Tax=Rubripirellula lacrimiformis TaxID=1930273 RepID=A0A517N4F0_9BACT|nr:IS4 family transposase [Rubripirellula lacrimiformis]QDT02009.1 Transposase DDE domain protein [Rubripirellula lacrimiformis]QDT05834.1 Transposase DDE domain protein [Rubripirellula lacrimiformis]
MSNSGKDAASKQKQSMTQGEQLAKAIRWIANDQLFAKVRVHGNANWVPTHLMQVAILWVWSSQSLLVESTKDAIKSVESLFGTTGIHSYQTLITALQKYTEQILPPLVQRMHHLMEKTDQASFRIGIWLVLAVDGSRLDACRTLANEKRFCKPKNKRGSKKNKKKNKRGRHANKRKPVSKKKNYNPQPVGPQVWLTLLWHVGQRLPWAWKIGPSYSSERAHLLEMLNALDLPKNTLICGDAGFVGYDFWNAIDSHGHHFLTRVGSNCRFLKQLGRVRERDGIVYCWPKEKQQRKQPPLVLRLLRFHDGRGEVYLVTNELNLRKLSDSRAGEIYRKRWGIEVQFRSLKQTYGRSKLLGRTPDVVEHELTWSLVGLWMAQLLALREQIDRIEPAAQTSVAMVLRILQNILHCPNEIPARGESLRSLLAGALTDTYDRASKKKSRNYPRRKEEPRTGPPTIELATAEQQKLAKAALDLSNAA